MFTRSTLSLLAATVSLACGSRAGAEAFDPLAAPASWRIRQTDALSSSYVLRGDATSLRGIGRDTIGPWLPASSMLRSEPAAYGLDDSPRAGGRLSFHRDADDDRAGTSSASISLGRLNLNEPRTGPALGVAPQADLDRELAALRDNVSRVRPVPQVSLGMRVKF
ncbi:MAG TPA: hypothetical protein VLE45_05930 [Burkholderiaceae bacterium]|nr:hypothetical protein [Burkholderiaceae bacterium]